MKLENRIGIVTGGANGIGRAIAIGLAKKGADLVIGDVEIEPANEVVMEIKALGRKAIAVETDVSNSEETKRMAQTTLDEFGRIDILVNNAGGSAREMQSLFHESREETWDFVIGRNLKGVLNCTRAVINHMIERRSGKILNIGSTAGILGQPRLADYSAAKGGIIAFSKALAKEVISYGINVNCVSPGPTQTRIMNVMDSEGKRLEILKKFTGFGRLGKPEEVAAMVVFLVSDEASLITGQNYAVCGLTNLGEVTMW
jgi:NAD(P)-dependent dehydrogenase (short-subunit alcohol dehydrogenase family)